MGRESARDVQWTVGAIDSHPKATDVIAHSLPPLQQRRECWSGVGGSGVDQVALQRGRKVRRLMA